MNLGDFRRLIAPIKNKIFLLMGRALLAAVKEESGMQKIQVTALSNETITDVERLQQYGLESFPVAGAEVFIAFLNGNRDQGVALCIQDKDARPTIVSGETALYSKNGNIITMKADGKVHILHNGGTLEFAPLSSKIKAYIDTQIKIWADTHIHSGVTPGGGVTGVAATPLVSPTLTDLSSTGVKIS